MNELLELIVHTESAVLDLIRSYGTLTYLILFLIIFCETGLVVTPFLPGDGLLLAVGVIANAGGFNIFLLVPILILAAILGNTSNFWIGKLTGSKIMQTKNKLFHKYYTKSHDFFEKHGDKAVVISRFFPIVRTYVPFVAGISEMNYKKYQRYNVLGAVAWVFIFTVGGYFIGEIPFLKNNFTTIFLIVMGLTLVPFVYGLLRTPFQFILEKIQR